MPSQLVLQRAPLAADLAEPRRQDDDAANAGVTALGDDVGDARRRGADHRQIGCARQLPHGGVGMDPLDRLALEIHRVYDAGESRTHQVGDRPIADLARGVAGADDGDALGTEDPVEVADAHRRDSRAAAR
jgi:hypothetical protein